MRSLLLTLVLAGVLGSSVARGDLEKGVYAPDIEAKDWLNTEEPISLKDMRGMVVVLYFWVSFHRGGEVMMSQVNIVHNHRVLGRERGVMVIGVTDSDRKRVEPVIQREKATFPVALESESFKEYEIESYPHAVVIDPLGRVVFAGDATQGDPIVQAIFDTLRDVPPSRTRPQEAKIANRRLEEARNALRDRSFQGAFRAARDAYEHTVVGDPLRARCQDVVELLDMVARDRMAQVDDLIDQRNFAKAIEELRWVIRNFQGAPSARDARKKLAALKKEYNEVADLLKGNSSTVEAVKLLASARSNILSARFGEAHDALAEIVEQHGKTDVGPIAEGILTRMRANSQVMEVLRDHLARRECEPLLARAKALIQAGRNSEAQAVLNDIKDKHPNTRYGREAIAMLINLR